MIVNVEMLAFGEGEMRPVELPDITGDTEVILEHIFHYGQNDFQPKPFPSVSCGDVIHYHNEKYLVSAVGFKLLSPQEYKNYSTMPRNERFFTSWE